MIQRCKLTLNDVSKYGKLCKLPPNDVSRYGELTVNYVTRYGKLRTLTVNCVTMNDKLHKLTMNYVTKYGKSCKLVIRNVRILKEGSGSLHLNACTDLSAASVCPMTPHRGEIPGATDACALAVPLPPWTICACEGCISVQSVVTYPSLMVSRQ